MPRRSVRGGCLDGILLSGLINHVRIGPGSRGCLTLAWLSIFGLSETGVDGGEGCHMSCDGISKAADSLPRVRRDDRSGPPRRKGDRPNMRSVSVWSFVIVGERRFVGYDRIVGWNRRVVDVAVGGAERCNRKAGDR